MAETIIEVTIDPQGNATVDVQGHHGSGCKAIADAFGSKLGAATDTKIKPEFYEGGGGSKATISS